MSIPREKKVVLITGCSPGGIGNSLARAFQRHGFHVIATARRLAVLDELADIGMTTLAVDVTKPESIAAAKEAVAALTGGRLDVLVNNAGSTYAMPLTDVSISEVKALFDANVFGVMAMIVAFAPLLKANADDGRFSAIVNISSQADRVPFPFKGAYAASKAALSEYSRTLAVELDPFHVRVLTVITGYVASRLGRDATGVAHQPVLPAESLFTPMARDLIRPSRDGERMPADEFAERIVREVLKENGWRMWVTGWRFGGMRDWIRAGGKTTAVWLLTWLGERVAKYAMLRQWPFWKLNAAMQEEEARKKK